MAYQCKQYFLYLSLLLLPLVGQAHAKPTAAVTAAVQAVQNDKLFKTASIGCYALNLTKGKIIGDVNATQSMIPASNLKVLTTAAALETLGKDFQFKTTIQYDGEIDEHGILHGNIYIQGGGDPALGSRKFQDYYYQPYFIATWVQAIQAKGIKKITGAVIGDDQIYADLIVPARGVVEDLGKDYGGEVSGLSIFDNLCTITLKAGGEGEVASVIGMAPPLPKKVQVISQAKGATIAHKKVYIKGFPDHPVRVIQGKIPCGKRVTVQTTSPDPAYWAAYTLHQALQEQAIEVTQSPTTVCSAQMTAATRKDVFTTLSPPLWQIIKVINHDSLNGYTEHLVKQLSLATVSAGDTPSGTQALKQFWEQRGIDVTGMLLFDGSGLSRDNAVTPQQLVDALCYMRHSPNFPFFYESLPIAGKTGNLDFLFQEAPLKGKLRAKSGYLANIREFSGYGTNQAGDKLVFAIIFNHYDGPRSRAEAAIEKILKVMVLQK